VPTGLKLFESAGLATGRELANRSTGCPLCKRLGPTPSAPGIQHGAQHAAAPAGRCCRDL